MRGYQVTFFTQQDRIHKGQVLAQWLLSVTKQLGIRGATLIGALQGIGHDGVVHALNMFDMADQPVQVTVIASEAEVERLFSFLIMEQVILFYVRIPVEFGSIEGEFES